MRSLPFLLLCAVFGVGIGLAITKGWQQLNKPSNQIAGSLGNGAVSSNPAPQAVPDETSLALPADGQATSRRPYSSHSYYDGIMRVAPSVVSIYARSGENNASQGSGVIVDSDGVVLTNLHIVEGSNSITVVLSNGERHVAQLIGSDRETDLAVVRISRTGLPALNLDAAPPLRVGDIVLAIGNPFGVGQTVTQGIVSATRRRVAGGTAWQNFVQIDAAINPGNSGGALINPDGQLVGVNTAVISRADGATGIGFSIPADLLAQVVPQIIEHGHVARGWLGIGVEDLTMFPNFNARGISGAVITSVLAGGPADTGGLRPMDIVTHLGEQNVENATDLLLMVSALPPGATTRIVINRDDSVGISLKMRLGARPDMGISPSE